MAFIGFYTSGVATLNESLFENERFNGRNDFQTFSQAQSNISRATRHFFLTLKDWASPPEGCRYDEAAPGDLRASQCAAFSQRLFQRFVIVFRPLWFFIGTLVLLYSWVRLFYLTARNSISKSHTRALARVTNPARASGDPFSWFSACHPVSVQVESGEQDTVYVAGDAPLPLPGERLNLCRVGVPFVGRRTLAVLYAPHMAIVQGS